jgi:hypothetical protein
MSSYYGNVGGDETGANDGGFGPQQQPGQQAGGGYSAPTQQPQQQSWETNPNAQYQQQQQQQQYQQQPQYNTTMQPGAYNNNNNAVMQQQQGLQTQQQQPPSFWNPATAATVAAVAGSMANNGAGMNSDAMLNLASTAGQSFLQNSAARMVPGLESTMLTLRAYFAVDNRYVVKKMKKVLFPFMDKQWRRMVRKM